MAIHRIHKTKDYSIMGNYHFREKEMSLKAKGLLSLMLSLPDEWDYSIDGLAKMSKDGKSSVISALKELEEHGYVKKYVIRKENGQILKHDYDVYEKPHSENPYVDNPDVEKPDVENQPQLNTKELNTKRLTTKEHIYSQVVDYLNEKSGKHYHVTKDVTSLMNARMSEGATLDDFKTVIDKKTDEWMDTPFEQYLRPKTLFSNKFDGYLNQPVKGKEQPKDYNVDEWNDKYKEIADRKERELYEKYGIDYE